MAIRYQSYHPQYPLLSGNSFSSRVRTISAEHHAILLLAIYEHADLALTSGLALPPSSQAPSRTRCAGFTDARGAGRISIRVSVLLAVVGQGYLMYEDHCFEIDNAYSIAIFLGSTRL
jgi:hypothetical protein